jgi:hypothetical protein
MMIANANKDKNLELDILGGSFCIYKLDTFEAVSTGTLESFRGNHEEMRKWALRKFDQLCK